MTNSLQTTDTLLLELQQELEAYKKTAPKIHFSPDQVFLPKDLYYKVQEYWDGKSIRPLTYTNAADLVYQHYKLPYPLYSYQSAWVNAFADQNASAMYFEVGVGKTATATVAALYNQLIHKSQTIILMPPILIRQWYEWLTTIEGAGKVLMYRGTPKEREKLDLTAEFILMSMEIFKRDFDRLYSYFETRNVTLIVDEAVSVKNPATQNHKCVWAFHNLDTRSISTVKRLKRQVKTEFSQVKKVDADAVSKLKAKLKDKYK